MARGGPRCAGFVLRVTYGKAAGIAESIARHELALDCAEFGAVWEAAEKNDIKHFKPLGGKRHVHSSGRGVFLQYRQNASEPLETHEVSWSATASNERQFVRFVRALGEVATNHADVQLSLIVPHAG